MGVQGYFLKKTEALHADLNEIADAATSSYSAAVDLQLMLQYVPSEIFFNDIHISIHRKRGKIYIYHFDG